MSDKESAEWCGLSVDDYRKMINRAHLLFLKRQRDRIAKMNDEELSRIEKIEMISKW